MVMIPILGREIDVAPYKLSAMTQAAPHIDRIFAAAGSIATMEGLLASSADFIAVLSIGLQKVDPTLTAEYLEEQLDLDDITKLQMPFQALMQASGVAVRGKAGNDAGEPGEGAVAAVAAE